MKVTFLYTAVCQYQ